MVYVNSKKFACESCIKGHRSSSCTHTDRPLFEVKKKGRPVSQCTKCRELRQSRKVHSKCTCNPVGDSPTPAELVRVLSGSKSRRFIPIVPALPNGLKDVLQASGIHSYAPADARQRVASLLNPCSCKSVWRCKCRESNPSGSKHERNSDALVLPAAMCCGEASASSSATPGAPMMHRSFRQSSPTMSSNKRPNHDSVITPGPDLPPIYLDVAPASTPLIPTFPTMPPLSTIASLAGSGCTCGVQCACPGCLEHRGAEHASKDRKDCANGCGTCVDHSIGIALPNSEPGTNYLDKFFARAAALPAPPANRKMGVGMDLDPMNVTVYPDAARDAGERGVAFGLVNLPKLECCSGRCECPNGTCGCGKFCSGRCVEHEDENTRKQGIIVAPEAAPLVQGTLVKAGSPVSRSCCAG